MKEREMEIESEQFICSFLCFIQEQAERFNTSEKFIEECCVDIIALIRTKQELEIENGY